NAWKQGHVSTNVVMSYMLSKLSEYGGGDIRTTDPKAITRIIQGNNLAVRRCLANLKEIVASGWEEYEQENKKELDTRSTTQGAFLTSEKQADRKSTRLNSSHVSISYAVFCLKKKKKITI